MKSLGDTVANDGQNDCLNFCYNYCQYYCEENIWHLCRASSLSHRPQFVLTISNAQGRVIFWSQKLASDPDTLICWDYHMVLLARQAGQPWMIYDFDSICGFPSEAERYFDQTFHSLPRQLSDYAPQFRLIPVRDFLRFFHSDRSHMQKPDGSWIHPPPRWPAILNDSGIRYTLSDLINVNRAQPGWVANLDQLRIKLNSIVDPEE